MKKTPIDKDLLYVIRLAQAELPVLTEQDVASIYEMLMSSDNDIKLLGVYSLNTFNYFVTPETVMSLFCLTDHNELYDEADTFPNIIRLLYLDSIRYKHESSETVKKYDLNLKKYAGTLDR